MMLLSLPKPKKNLQPSIEGVMGLEFLVLQNRNKDLAALLGYK